MAKPRVVGPIPTEKGVATGIGLQNEDSKQTHVLVAYVKEDSAFAADLKNDDEILEINGVPVKNAKEAAQSLIDASPSVTLLVRRLLFTRDQLWLHADLCSLTRGG